MDCDCLLCGSNKAISVRTAVGTACLVRARCWRLSTLQPQCTGWKSPGACHGATRRTVDVVAKLLRANTSTRQQATHATDELCKSREPEHRPHPRAGRTLRSV